MKTVGNFIICFLFIASGSPCLGQTVPVGTPFLEEALRRAQIKGGRDLTISYTIRPVELNSELMYDSILTILNPFAKAAEKNNFSYLKGKGIVKLLPVSIKQQFNTHHPYGRNDGSMIPAKGYQSQVTFGFYSKIGPLDIQIQPEIVFAQNKDFPTFPSSHSDIIWNSYYNVLNQIDNPEKYGNGKYFKFFPGQSSVRLNFRKLSLGLSTENLWWGPGVQNSLVMSNNAPGFKHLSFNTRSPVLSPVGSLEWQIISGFLQKSGILPPDTARMFNGQTLYQPKPIGNRYLNGIIVTWQPKWTKNLFLGITRVYNINKSDVQSNLNGYLPVFGKLFKHNPSDESNSKTDQILSVFFRLVLPKEQAEIYGEFGRNDHSADLRDLILEPEHSRAYLFGLKKIFESNKSSELELTFELANLQLSSTGSLREEPSWYIHDKVQDGYTNLGQVIGAGIGPGGSSQTLGLNWIKSFKKFGVILERMVHNNDFYYDAFEAQKDFKSHWVDLSINFNKNWSYKRFIYSADLTYIRSYNYEWQIKKDENNLHAAISISYLF